jgi:predicted MPP superfamily phosphohydrolase
VSATSTLPSRALVGASTLAIAGAAGLAYARWEAANYQLRRVTISPLPIGHDPIRVLHLSDLHLTPGRRRLQEWVRALAALSPDLVVVTGDIMSHEDAVPLALHALAPLEGVPSVFVLGSNDYFAPRPVNPLSYFAGPSTWDPQRQQLPWADLITGLQAAGWHYLGNTNDSIELPQGRLDLRGVDDPHIERDDYASVSGVVDHLTFGITHAPYRRVLDAMSTDGVNLVLAGHTHGGQLRVPGVGALVTNCDIDRARARGASRYGTAHLHVSAGLGTSPFAPFRFACPPEATLLTLTASG